MGCIGFSEKKIRNWVTQKSHPAGDGVAVSLSLFFQDDQENDDDACLLALSDCVCMPAFLLLRMVWAPKMPTVREAVYHRIGNLGEGKKSLWSRNLLRGMPCIIIIMIMTKHSFEFLEEKNGIRGIESSKQWSRLNEFKKSASEQ